MLARLRPSQTCYYLCADRLEEEEGGTLARKVGEVVTNTLGAVATAIDIPLGEWAAENNNTQPGMIMQLEFVT